MPMVSTKTRVAKPGGFSLVELLVVVMVILVIAAIAIPNMVNARMRANEAAAVASMKTINTAEVLYATEFPNQGYAPSLAQLGANGTDCDTPGPSNGCIIMDEALTSGLKSGYIFEVLGDGKTPSTSYTLTAMPASPGFSGSCGFSSGDSGGVVKVSPNAGAGRLAMGSGGSCN